jgi:dTDP-4-dehydrorhamnose reductase
MGRLLITGGSGMLGSYIAVRAAELGWETWATYTNHGIELEGCNTIRLDIRKAGDVIETFSSVKPDVVIHTAALVRPDLCEERKAEAFSVNVLGTHNVVSAVALLNAHLVHISTDTIFDGERGVIAPNSFPCPINFYGATKAAAEAAVLASEVSWAIVRTSIIYGPRMFPWLDSFSDKIIETLRAGKTFGAFIDQYRQPIPVWNLAEAIIEIASRRLSGIYHIACPEVSSRFQFARKVAEVFSLNPELVEPLYMDEVHTLARRPKILVLDTTKTQHVLETPLLSFEQGIYQLLARMNGA